MAARDLARALHRVDTQVDLSSTAGDHQPVREVRLVARAQDNGGGETGPLERLAHRVARGVADAVRVAFAEETSARQRRRFGGMHQVERELALLPIYGPVGRWPGWAAPLLLHVSPG